MTIKIYAARNHIHRELHSYVNNTKMVHYTVHHRKLFNESEKNIDTTTNPRFQDDFSQMKPLIYCPLQIPNPENPWNQREYSF